MRCILFQDIQNQYYTLCKRAESIQATETLESSLKSSFLLGYAYFGIGEKELVELRGIEWEKEKSFTTCNANTHELLLVVGNMNTLGLVVWRSNGELERSSGEWRVSLRLQSGGRSGRAAYCLFLCFSKQY